MYVGTGDFASVDIHGELILVEGKHAIDWIGQPDPTACVVDVQRRGLVILWPIEVWLARRAIHADQLDEDVAEERTAFLGEIKRKKRRKASENAPGRSRTLELRLPDMALFVLFEQGTGLNAVTKGSAVGESGKVLVVVCEDRVELWGREMF